MKFVVGLVVAVVVASAVSGREPQKIRVFYESYIPEGWVARDQFGTYGMGDTREEAIADCKNTYRKRLAMLGVAMDNEQDEIESKATVSVKGCEVTLRFASEKEAAYWAGKALTVGFTSQPARSKSR